MVGLDGFGETLGSAPGAEGMGTGGADTYFEHVEDGNGFVWQELWNLGKVRTFLGTILYIQTP